MNTDTGQIYMTRREIKAAQGRNEPLMPITKGFADWTDGLNARQKKKVAAKLSNIRRCQPQMSLTQAQNLARKVVLLG